MSAPTPPTIDFRAAFTMSIGGIAIDSAERFDAIDPATETTIASVPDASASQLDAAVRAARGAFGPWAATPVTVRQARVAGIAKLLMQHAGELSQLLTREQGKPLAAARAEIESAAWWCAEFAKMSAPVELIEDSDKVRVQVRHLPLGVVGAIVPWNFPVALALWKVAPALIAGNTVVLKPSPYTPLTTLKIGELLRAALPAGVLNVVSGSDRLGPWMSAHPDIDKISFTGSTATGRRVMQSASANLKRLTLELGGNDAAIVLPDINLDKVVPQLFWGAFHNSAQFCLAIKRLYVHDSIYNAVAERFVALAREARIGRGDEPGVQLGPVQNRAQFERLKALVADSRSNGHRFLTGGEPAPGRGYFFPVTLIDNPPDDARVVCEEAFGPILPLLRYRSVDEAVARANASEYGLGASVWARDASVGEGVAQRLQAGTVWVNEIHSLSPHKPVAGHKQSGIGVENGVEGLLEYTVPQTITVRKTAGVPLEPTSPVAAP